MERRDDLDRIHPRERLRHACRLRSAREFQRVRQCGHRVSGELLVLTCAWRPDGLSASGARVGFSVSKRVGGAVVRNRVKRRLREIIRRELRQIPPTWDIIVAARPAAAAASALALEGELRGLLVSATRRFARDRGDR